MCDNNKITGMLLKKEKDTCDLLTFLYNNGLPSLHTTVKH